MTIYRTAHATNFTILHNDIANSTLSPYATTALLYLITKPENWQFNAKDVKRRLGCCIKKVYQVMKELVDANYAKMIRIQKDVIWHIYDTKQTIESPVAPVKPYLSKSYLSKKDLTYKEIKKLNKEINTTTPTPTQPTIVKDVVVDIEESNESLIYPKDLTPQQKKACKSVIKKAPFTDQQPILFALAYQLTQQKINSVPGYLNKLVTAALNDEFTAIGAASASIPINSSVTKTNDLLSEYRNIKPSKPINIIASLRSAIVN